MNASAHFRNDASFNGTDIPIPIESNRAFKNASFFCSNSLHLHHRNIIVDIALTYKQIYCIYNEHTQFCAPIWFNWVIFYLLRLIVVRNKYWTAHIHYIKKNWKEDVKQEEEEAPSAAVAATAWSEKKISPRAAVAVATVAARQQQQQCETRTWFDCIK